MARSGKSAPRALFTGRIHTHLRGTNTKKMLLRAIGVACAVSRPYYWLVTLWLYLLPTGGRTELFGRATFWLGVGYCTLPLNLMCYLMNDLADHKVDAHNPRKGSSLLGAKADLGQLRAAIPATAALQLTFVAFGLAPIAGVAVWPWLAAVFAVNWLYNFGPRLSGNYAPLDLICPCGYILVVPLSCWLNALPYPPARSWAHAGFLVLRTQVPSPPPALPATGTPRHRHAPPPALTTLVSDVCMLGASVCPEPLTPLDS